MNRADTSVGPGLTDVVESGGLGDDVLLPRSHSSEQKGTPAPPLPPTRGQVITTPPVSRNQAGDLLED